MPTTTTHATEFPAKSLLVAFACVRLIVSRPSLRPSLMAPVGAPAHAAALHVCERETTARHGCRDGPVIARGRREFNLSLVLAKCTTGHTVPYVKFVLRSAVENKDERWWARLDWPAGRRPACLFMPTVL